MPVGFRFCLTQPRRAPEVASSALSYARTSRVVRMMVHRSSHAASMVQRVDGDHSELCCMLGCHGKHRWQPEQLTCHPVKKQSRR